MPKVVGCCSRRSRLKPCGWLDWVHNLPKNGLKIEIHVHNYSAVSAEVLARAEQETTSIFERIGVAIAWLVCPPTPEEAVWNKACELPDTFPRLTLRLLSNSMVEGQGAGSDILGSAHQLANEGFGVVADAYADRVRELPSSGECVEVNLGRIIVHELASYFSRLRLILSRVQVVQPSQVQRLQFSSTTMQR